MSERFVCVALLLAGLVLILWDLVAVWVDRWDLTVSARMLLSARRQPVALFLVAFLAGVLVGHWFWPQGD